MINILLIYYCYRQIYVLVITYRSPTAQNQSDFDNDLLQTVNVKCNGANRFPLYGFLLGKCVAYAALFRDTHLPDLSELDFDLSRSLKVKYNCVLGLPIYDILLLFHGNIFLSRPLYEIKGFQM